MIRQPSGKLLSATAAILAVTGVAAVLAGARAGAGKPEAPTVAAAPHAACPAEPGCTGRPECTPQTGAGGDACCPAPAQTSQRSAASAAPVSGAPAAASAGMIVARDPETGRYGMPTPEQIAELSAAEKQAVSHSAEGLVEVRHPDGSVSVDLQGRFQEYSVARIGADGKPLIRCGDDPAAALRALDAPAAASASNPAPAAPEER